MGGFRMFARLRRPLVLGKNRNKWGQWKSSVVEGAVLAVIGHRGMDVKVRVVGAGDIGVKN